MGRYGSAIHWLETVPRTPRPPLEGPREVDVAVIGGGFTGLWTAYHLLEAEPSARVAVIEREEVGFGASGRNGGFAMPLLDMSLAHLRRRQGVERARAAHEAVVDSVEQMGEVVETHAIDCEWHHGGLMVVATSAGQLDRIEADLAAAEEMGIDGITPLTARQAQEEVASPTYLGGFLEDACAVVNPARLARGLADVVEHRGAEVYESTGLTSLEELDGRLRIATPRGELVADQVVLATNAWASSTPWFRAKVVPLHTYIVLTEPIDDDLWDEIGWQRRQGVEDKRNFVHYYRRTADGRILWGGSDGVIYHPTRRIRPSEDRNEAVFARLRATFRRTFPQLAGVRFTHQWGGPVGMTTDFLPAVGTLLDGRLHYALGYNGHGVAPSHTAGRILRDKLLGRDSELTGLCFVDHHEGSFPPDPLRWVGAELTRRSLRRQDDRLDRGEATGEMDPLLMRIADRLG